MIENLKFEAPHVWKIIRDKLIGNEGIPDADGDAAGGLVREAEIKYNAYKGEYWYRFFRPDDAMINGGTAHTYDTTFTTVTEEHILSSGNVVTVQTREAIVSFGWFCNVDLGKGGYLLAKKETVTKSEVPARWVYRQRSPKHYWFDFDTVIQAFENTRLDWVIYNQLGSDRAGVAIPLLFRIAPRTSLNLEKKQVK